MSNPGNGADGSGGDERDSGGDGDGTDGDAVDWLGDVEWSEEPPDGPEAESAGSHSPEPVDRIGESPPDRRDTGNDTGSRRIDAKTAGGRDGDDTEGGGVSHADPDRGDPGSGVGTGGTDTSDADLNPSESTDRIRAALSEVRREVRKAAVIHAAAEGALVAVVAGFLLSLATPAALSGVVGLPGVVFEALRRLPIVGAVAPRIIGVGWFAAAGLGLVAFVAAFGLRLRRPLIEQFEAANPPVREALRTARDAVEGGRDTEMARRLYADVIATLRETSSLELVAGRRLVVTGLLIAVVAIAGVQVAVVSPDLGGFLAGGDAGTGVQQPDDEELQDGEEILGDAEDVEAGDEVENITVPGTGEGGDGGPTAPGVGTGGGGGSGEFDSQQAGFAGNDRIEDAELVREYNLRIREFDDADATNDETA